MEDIKVNLINPVNQEYDYSDKPSIKLNKKSQFDKNVNDVLIERTDYMNLEQYFNFIQPENLSEDQIKEFQHELGEELKNYLEKQSEYFKKNKEEEDDPIAILIQLESFLVQICQIVNQKKILENCQQFLRFFEISFIPIEGNIKYKECYMNKRSGGRFQESSCARCGVFWRTWQKRYFSITSEGVGYCLGPGMGQQSQIRDMLIFSKNFNIFYGKQMTGYKLGIILENYQRRLLLEALDVFQFYDILYAIQEAYKKSDYCGTHYFSSFAPERQNVFCKWYIDGENYYLDILQALNEAISEIYITDWWLSPHLLLQRPDKDDSSRLDLVLQKAAQRGVLIKIVVYTESKYALTIDSIFTKQYLESLHSNITVQRHPGYIFPFLWSHHEKIVVVDQTVGFFGGLDLCYGRWDNQKHCLFDPSQEKDKQIWPGIDYSNVRIQDFSDVRNFQRSDIDRNSNQRLPWHDIAIRVIGMPVRDLSIHFITYWNFASLDLEYRDKARSIQTTSLQSEVKFFDKIKLKIEQYKIKKEEEKQKKNKSKVIQKQNFRKDNQKMISLAGYDQDILQNIEQQINKQQNTNDDLDQEEEKEEDMKNYLMEQQNDYLNEDLDTESIKNEQEIVQQNKKFTIDLQNNEKRDTFKKKQKQFQSFEASQSKKVYFSPVKLKLKHSKSTDKKDTYNYDCLDPDLLQMIANILKNKNEENVLLKGFENPQNPFVQKLAKEGIYKYNKEENYKNIKDQLFDLPQQIQEKNANKYTLILKPECKNKNQQIGQCKCQIIRSSSLWSCGIKETECSIYMAYIQLIGMAQHFIYIENQFFISSLAGEPVENLIANAIFSRIRHAIKNKQRFRVIIVMPLMPAFTGDIDQNGVLKVQLYWQYKTISRGENSLIEQIKKLGVDPFDYISFFSLRTHGKLNNQSQPTTEIVYVHSKLMIVDDQFALIGSANINDRSLLGWRDSEIGMVIQDTKVQEIKMNGQLFEANTFAHTLRKSLFQEHFALSNEEAIDPICDETYKKIRQIASKNTKIYRDIFRCYPDDNIKRIIDIPQFVQNKNLELYEQQKQEIRGYAVEFPLNYMENENLQLNVTNKEYVMPAISFT